VAGIMETQSLKTDIKFNYEDYLRFPDDGKRYQIIEGEVYMVPAPNPYHQMILSNVESILRSFVKAGNLDLVLIAPCDVVFSYADVVQPDIFFISQGRSSIITDKNIQGSPDLVVEVISSHTGKLDRTLKRSLYARFGVKEYWLVNPDRKEVEVLVHKQGSYESMGVFCHPGSFESPLLKGLVVDLKEVF
jgi:Uma2 family endonuclease